MIHKCEHFLNFLITRMIIITYIKFYTMEQPTGMTTNSKVTVLVCVDRPYKVTGPGESITLKFTFVQYIHVLMEPIVMRISLTAFLL